MSSYPIIVKSPEGVYRAVLGATDFYGGRAALVTEPLTIGQFAGDQFLISEEGETLSTPGLPDVQQGKFTRYDVVG